MAPIISFNVELLEREPPPGPGLRITTGLDMIERGNEAEFVFVSGFRRGYLWKDENGTRVLTRMLSDRFPV